MVKFISFMFVSACLVSCAGNGFEKAEDAGDAGREFVRASLDGNYSKAYFYLFKDSSNTNVMLLDRWRKDYNKRKQEDKVAYKDASIIAISIDELNDSTVNFVYSNTFKVKDTTSIKIVKVNGEWLVDLQDIH